MYHSRFKGTHYQIGYKWGKMLFKNNHLFLDNVPFKLTQERKEFALQCLPYYQEYFPEVVEEIQGIADGQECSFESICSVLFSMYCIIPEIHCSCFVLRNQKEILLGRNSDFLTEIEKLYTNCIYQFSNESYSFNGNTTACVEIEDGINEYGLAVGLTSVYPTVKKPGLNAGMMLRLFLEKCKTVNEVIELIKILLIASSQTFILADTSGNNALIECNAEKTEIVSNSKTVWATNLFHTKKMEKYNNYEIDDWNGELRYQTIAKAVLKEQINSFDDVVDLLSGKYGFLCQYERRTGKDTVWSVIYDLKQKKIYRVEGNPSRKKFVEDKRFKFR